MGGIRLSVEDLKKRIQEKLEEKPPEKRVSIYRVPLVLSQKNKEAYIPKWVSVGPFHHEAAHLSSDMKTQKERALLRMMSRLSPHNPNMSTFHQIVGEVKKYEDRIRNSYEMDIDCDAEHLACMMALDGCFVLEILRCLSVKTPNDDPFFNRHNIEQGSYTLLADIFLLENQIPLFVLINILKLEMKSDIKARRKLAEMLINDHEIERIFSPFIFKKEEWSRQVEALIRGEEAAHLLDLANRVARGNPSTWSPHDAATEEKEKWLCFNILCKRRSKVEKRGDRFTIPSATELYEAGIDFEPCEGGLMTVCFSDEKNTLQLPIINARPSAAICLRNLIAYEIRQSPEKRLISNFAVLMEELINTERDVALLRQGGIIHSYSLRRDKDVASFFNDLRKGVIGAGSNYTDTFSPHRKKLLGYYYHRKYYHRKFYHRKCRLLFAEFVRLHFSKPWRTASAAAAVMLLLMTFLQTFYAIKGRQPS